MKCARALAITALCLFVASASGARLPLQVAPAPAPATAAGGSAAAKADLLFVVSGNTATFNTGSTLTIANVSQTAQFTSTSGRSGIYPMGYFVNGSAFFAADGKWLDTPQAALYGSTAQGNQTVVLLSLTTPAYDPVKQTLTFTYAVVAPGKTPKYTSGAVATAAADSTNGVGVPIAGQVQDGGVLGGVALFIDENQAALHPNAETKTWWYPWWGGGWGGNRGWGWGGGWNGGWNNGWNGGWNNWNGGWGGGSQVVVINNGWGK